MSCHVFVFFVLSLDTDAEILPQNRKGDVNHKRRSWKERGSYMKKGTSARCSGGNGQLNIFLQASDEKRLKLEY